MHGNCVLNLWKYLGSIRYNSSGNAKSLLAVLAQMPKPNTGGRQGPNYLQKPLQKGIPSNIYLQVIGSGARGAPNALYLFTDHNRYLFNCGESTQRLALEYKVKVSRLDHIFITTKSWKNLGGLPGLSITLQQVGLSDITLHGPEGLGALYNATKGFVVMKDMNVNLAKCSPGVDYEDSAIKIKYVVLYNSKHDVIENLMEHAAKKPKLSDPCNEFENFVNDDTDYYNRQSVSKAKPTPADNANGFLHKLEANTYIQTKENVRKKNDQVLANLQKMNVCSIAYICSLKDKMGTLNLEKCVEFGVKPGPLLGKLKNGLDVVLPDGTLVKSSDVKTPDEPGPVFIVLDIPEITYLKQAEFKAHFDNDSNPPKNIPSLIVHFTPPHVFHNSEYQAFLSQFGPTTRHLVLNEQNNCLGSEAVHRMQHKLHLLDPEIFPLLHDISIPAMWNTPGPVVKSSSPRMMKGLEELKNKIALAQFQNIINLESSCTGRGQVSSTESKLDIASAKTMTIFHLSPRKQFGLDRSVEPKLNIKEYIQETMDVDGFAGSLDKFKRTVEELRYSRADVSKEFPKVIFLGTGSSMPGKTRNVSAVVVHVSEDRAVLLDCGEGTYLQIVRFYGQKRADHFLRNLRAIYVSHLHADHHLGLIGVMQARRRAFERSDEPVEPLYLLAPGQIMAWLSLYDKQFEKILDNFTLVPNQSLLDIKPNVAQGNKNYQPVPAAVFPDIGVSDINTCFVSHCPNAFGVSLTIDDKYKITYSGDTIPCQELVRIGQNSTLLIHEATMEDELLEDARMKMHSTTSQAIDIGRQMKARFTVLTHFSQRYARIPRLIEHLLQNNMNVGIAYDYMQITMSDLDILPHIYPPLQLMFAEHCVEMELKAAVRQRKIDRPSTRTPSPARAQSTGRKIYTKIEKVSEASQPQVMHYKDSNSSRLRHQQYDNRKVRERSKSLTSSPRTRTSVYRAASPCPTEDLRCSGTCKSANNAKRSSVRSPTRKPSEQSYKEQVEVRNESSPPVQKSTLYLGRVEHKENLSTEQLIDSGQRGSQMSLMSRSNIKKSAITNPLENFSYLPYSETSKEVMEIMTRINKSRIKREDCSRIRRPGQMITTNLPPNRKSTIRRDILKPILPPDIKTPKKSPNCLSNVTKDIRKRKDDMLNNAPKAPDCDTVTTKESPKVHLDVTNVRNNAKPKQTPATKRSMSQNVLGTRAVRQTNINYNKTQGANFVSKIYNDRSRTNQCETKVINPISKSSNLAAAANVRNRITRSPASKTRIGKVSNNQRSIPTRSASVTENLLESINQNAMSNKAKMMTVDSVFQNPPHLLNKGYKPQLEDIKSSFILLTKNQNASQLETLLVNNDQEINIIKPKHKLTLKMPNCQVKEEFSDCYIPKRSNSDFGKLHENDSLTSQNQSDKGAMKKIQPMTNMTPLIKQSIGSVDRKANASKIKASVVDSKSTVKIKNPSRSNITSRKISKETKPKFNNFSSSPTKLNSVNKQADKNFTPVKADRTNKVPSAKVRQETLNEIKRKFMSKQYHDTSRGYHHVRRRR